MLNLYSLLLIIVIIFLFELLNHQISGLQLIVDEKTVTNRLLAYYTTRYRVKNSKRKNTLCRADEDVKRQICIDISKEKMRILAITHLQIGKINVDDMTYNIRSQEPAVVSYVCKKKTFRYKIIGKDGKVKYKTKKKRMYGCPKYEVSFTARGKDWRIPKGAFDVSKGDEPNTGFVFQIVEWNEKNLPRPAYYATDLNYENLEGSNTEGHEQLEGSQIPPSTS